MADGEVTYEIVVYDGDLEMELNDVNIKVAKSAKETSKLTEKAEREAGEEQKRIKEEVTEHHEKQNADRESSDENSTGEREVTAEQHGEKLKSLAGGAAKVIGAGFVDAGLAVAEVGASAVNSAIDMDKAMNQFIASTGKGTEESERYQNVLEKIYVNNYGEDFTDIASSLALVTMNMGKMDDASLQSVTESAFSLRDVFQYDIAETTGAAKAMMQSFGMSGEDAMNLIAAGAQNGLDYSDEMMEGISNYSVQFAKVGLDADDMFHIIQSGSETNTWNFDKIGKAIEEMSNKIIGGSDATSEGFHLIGLDADEMADRFAQGGESAKSALEETIKALSEMKDPLAQNTAGANLFGTMWQDLGPDVVTQLADIGDAAYATGEELNQLKDVKSNDLGSIFEELKRSVEMLLIPLGEQLIPLLAELIEGALPLIEQVLPPIVELFSDFALKLQEMSEGMVPIIQEVLPLLLDIASAIVEPLILLTGEVLPVLADCLQTILEPLMELAGNVLPILSELWTAEADVLGKMASEVLPVLTEMFALLMESLTPLIENLLPVFLDILNQLIAPITELIETLLPVMQELFSAVIEPVAELAESLFPVFKDIIDALLPVIVSVIEIVGALGEMFGAVIGIVLDLVIPVIQRLAVAFSGTLKNAIESIAPIINSILNVFKGLIDFITGIFTGNWEKAWNGIVDIFSGIISGIGNIFKIPINFIIDGINEFIKGLNNIKLPDWVPFVGGKSFNIGLIPRLKKGLDFVPGDYFPSFLDYGERVLTQTENMRFNAIGGLDGMERSLSVDGSINSQPKIILGKGCIVVQSEIDGKLAGEALAPYVDTELGELEAWKERGVR